MYCNNCGRENPDDVKFCCFCGTRANAVSRSIEEIPNKISENLAENGQLDFEENENISEKIDENPQIPEPPIVPISPNSSVNSAMSSNNFAFPQPQPIIQQGVSHASRPVQNTPTMVVPAKVPDENKSVVRTFTLKHIIMCLVSTAVCAIAAGVFAGLYFSVI